MPVCDSKHYFVEWNRSHPNPTFKMSLKIWPRNVKQDYLSDHELATAQPFAVAHDSLLVLPEVTK
jgi:hypothetical protein